MIFFLLVVIRKKMDARMEPQGRVIDEKFRVIGIEQIKCLTVFKIERGQSIFTKITYTNQGLAYEVIGKEI